MRADALGFFWRDEPPKPKEKSEKPKRTPPDPVWLKPDYLPGLDEAKQFPVSLMTDADIVSAAMRKERLIFDTECYSNYFLAAFTSLVTGKVVYFEMTPSKPLDINRFGWVMQNFTTVGFYSNNYDLPMTTLALNGRSCTQLKEASDKLIVEGWRPGDILKQNKLKALKFDHIDLIEVAPLRASLKTYAGRLHAPRMQDLPFHPSSVLTEDQIAIIRWYCVNDLTNTAFLHETLIEQIKLREQLTQETGIDVRSKSDAQIAEAVIADELERRTGRRPRAPLIDVGTVYRYRLPHYLKFATPLMNAVADRVISSGFVVAEDGSIDIPPALKGLDIPIGDSVYRMGIGGLHSREKSVCHVSDDIYILRDKDVISYYPKLMLNLGIYPKHIGPIFLEIFRTIVERRIAAKEKGLKAIAESLKIVVNGAYGKLASAFSIMYSPDNLINVTLTGQLSLLMLIERLELSGIKVVSANTDGVVIKCKRVDQALCDAIVAQWERETGLQLEEAVYKRLASRDVNNYIAVKEDGSTKTKGAYFNPWASTKNPAEKLKKNPTSTVCIDAVEAFLINGTPIDHTIRSCRKVERFVSVRNVSGGAVKDGEYLGKAIRWYYSTKGGEIVYAKNGNKVPRSDGAMPLMQIPKEIPEDIDYDWYIRESEKHLVEIGYSS